jgi:enamine deaminase RidA (YjgF/YER057c/UK114 family)
MRDQALIDKLGALGLQLPDRCEPRGLFLPWIRSGAIVYLAGQISEWNGEVRCQGRVEADVTIDEAQRAATVCALNLLFHLRAACAGDLGQVRRCLRVGAFVNAPPGFCDSPRVANGASQLFISLWGEAGRHVRTAVGVSALPMNATVEIDAIFETESE